MDGGKGGIRTHVPAHHRQLDFESSALRPLRYLSASRFCLVHEASPAGKPFFRGYAEALSSGLPPALQREYTTLLHIGMELGDECIEPIEAFFFPKFADETHFQHAAVDVA